MDRRASFAHNKIGTGYGGCARLASICDCGGGRRGGKFQGSPSAGRLEGVGGGAAGELIRVRAGGVGPSAHFDQNGGFARVSGSGLAQVSMVWSPRIAESGGSPRVLVRCRKLGELSTCLHLDDDAEQGGVSAWRQGGTPPNAIDLPPSMYRRAIFQDLGSISPSAFLCDAAQAGTGSQFSSRRYGVRGKGNTRARNRTGISRGLTVRSGLGASGRLSIRRVGEADTLGRVRIHVNA